MSRVFNWFDIKLIHTQQVQIPIAATAGLYAAKSGLDFHLQFYTRLTQSTDDNPVRLMLASSKNCNRKRIKPLAPFPAKLQNRFIYQPSIPITHTLSGKTSEMINNRSKIIDHAKSGQFVDVYMNMNKSGSCFCYYFKHQFDLWRKEDPKQLIEKVMRSLSPIEAKKLATRIKPNDYTIISPQTMMVLAGLKWRTVPKKQKEVRASL